MYFLPSKNKCIRHKTKLKPIRIASTTVSATTLHNSEYPAMDDSKSSKTK